VEEFMWESKPVHNIRMPVELALRLEQMRAECHPGMTLSRVMRKLLDGASKQVIATAEREGIDVRIALRRYSAIDCSPSAPVRQKRAIE
jgi:hypothetical protein